MAMRTRMARFKYGLKLVAFILDMGSTTDDADANNRDRAYNFLVFGCAVAVAVGSLAAQAANFSHLSRRPFPTVFKEHF